ncbi:low-density lipoprotein receptor class A domain-containing protein 2 [Carlito syrichta]|uniref:Low-density lipoprotein receptor class A domain-containing protein 2 n=1 Tax=Carlito syrichta TaxID=1868482 RepID=A0A1U7TWW2_CARSF|nr:low-density lipoprotein receptor class A domain-containing protein 2 [Carlito syrichta]
MEACLLLLPQRFLLLGVVALTVSALETADLVDLCGRTRRGDALLLRSHPASRSFYFVAPDTDCRLWVRAAAPGDRIRFQFRFFRGHGWTLGGVSETHVSKGRGLLELKSQALANPAAFGPLHSRSQQCLTSSAGPVTLALRLEMRQAGEVTGLGPCGAYFRCRNGRCVPTSLVCDRWGMDNCGDGSDQGPWPPANCRDPSLAPSWAGSTEANTSKPPMLSLALGSAGSLWIAAEQNSPAGQDSTQQDAALEGPRLRGVALAFSLLLASAGLLLGFVWCCCSPGRLAWQPGARGLCLGCGATGPICCYTCPDRVAPGGLRLNGPAMQDQEGHP